MPLKRALGIGALTFYGIGIILGAGIYSVLGAAETASFPVLPAVGVASTIAVATQLDSTAIYGGCSALALFSAYSYAKQRQR